MFPVLRRQLLIQASGLVQQGKQAFILSYFAGLLLVQVIPLQHQQALHTAHFAAQRKAYLMHVVQHLAALFVAGFAQGIEQGPAAPDAVQADRLAVQSGAGTVFQRCCGQQQLAVV